MSDVFEKIGLYDHNKAAYKKVKEAFDKGEKIVGIVHATGTGKTYNALALAYDNRDKKTLFVVPYASIIDHIENIIESNPNLDRKRDFPNLVLKTYQSFVSMKREEIESLEFDYLILDEFHHIGAPIWGDRIDELITTHKDANIFGMTAYTIRDRGTIYERDMASSEGNELFSDKIVSIYDLCDALIDGVLPKPIYRSAHIRLQGLAEYLEKKVYSCNAEESEKKKYIEMIENIKRRITNALSMKDVVAKNIKRDGKYIYFCPPVISEGTNDIETIMKEALEWFKTIIPEEKIVFYKTTSNDRIDGKKNRDAFYNDTTLEGEDAKDCLRVMFAINQYNEGIHAPNVDGVIMGRSTSSDIVFFEQLGRALSVNGNSKDLFKEYNTMSIEELKQLADSRDFTYDETVSREELIEKLVAPVVIDLTDNYEFIKELEDNLKERVKCANRTDESEKRELKIGDGEFDLVFENQDIFEMLGYLKERMTYMTWDAWYYLAENYYREYKHLKVPSNFKTLNGTTYDTNGFKLGLWIQRQRTAYKMREEKDKRQYSIKALSDEQVKRLENIGMIFDIKDDYWEFMYTLAENYYSVHKNLKVRSLYRTSNGYEYDKYGYALGEWIRRQRANYQYQNSNKSNRILLTEKQIKRLEKIGMIFDNVIERQWDKMYSLACNYYANHGDLLVPIDFKTVDGIAYDENGKNLGQWIRRQRKTYSKGIENVKNSISEKRIEKLLNIGMVFSIYEAEWNRMYDLAKKFYEENEHLRIPAKFKTKNGIEFDPEGDSLGSWISEQRESYMLFAKPTEQKKSNRKPLTQDKVDRLLEIGMIFDYKKERWDSMFALAEKYYEVHKNLNVLATFSTTNGYEYDPDGEKLGLWISRQRKAYSNGLSGKKGKNTMSPLSESQIVRLESIGMIFNVNKNRKEVKALCVKYGISYDYNIDVLEKMSYPELKAKIEFLISLNNPLTHNLNLHEIFSMSSINMKAKYGLDLKTLLEIYYRESKELKL